jgi:hypothetical protein
VTHVPPSCVTGIADNIKLRILDRIRVRDGRDGSGMWSGNKMVKVDWSIGRCETQTRTLNGHERINRA